MKHCIRIAAVVGALFLSACGTDGAFSVSVQRARWSSRGPASYTYTLSRTCECLEEMSGPVLVSVRDGVVESRVYTRTNVPVTSTYAALFPAVEGLFELIAAAQAAGQQLDLRFDATYSYPTIIDIDRDQHPVDGGVKVTAGGLVAR